MQKHRVVDNWLGGSTAEKDLGAMVDHSRSWAQHESAT